MIQKTLGTINWFSERRVKEYPGQYTAFGIFGLVNYIVPYFMWSFNNSTDYSAWALRVFASLFCFILVIRDEFPIAFKRYLPLYWHFTLLYCLPFLTTYMLLDNHASTGWLMNMVLALLLLVLLVDWLSFTIILGLGVFFGWAVYWFLHGPSSVELNEENLSLSLYMYVFSVAIGVIFSRNRERLEREKLQSIKALSGAIAHEMRTPLASINLSSIGIRTHLPKLLKAYEIVKNKDLLKDTIDPMHLSALYQIADNLQSVSHNAQTIIDMLLIKLSENPVPDALQPCSINKCVQKALEDYPFDEEEKKLLRWIKSEDFIFLGSELLMTHILFNLLKNSLYYVISKPDGLITIWTEQTAKTNRLHFKDTGKGIPAHILPHIFDKFYSKTKHGTGIGLAFCRQVVQGFGGDMVCKSVEGRYTEFVMTFPKYLEKKEEV